MYEKLKKLIPSKMRQILKPYYLSWNLRGFEGEAVASVRDGAQQFQIVLNRSNGAVDEYIYIHRNWEPHIGATLRTLLQPGNTFIDVGANIGYFSLLAALMVGKGGRVVAFEPLPQLVKQIQTSAEINEFGHIEVRQCALGDTSGTMQLTTAPTNIGGSSLVAARVGESVAVSVRTLDNELVDAERIDVMKIDVEGFEYEMLCGAKMILAKHQPTLIIEFSPHMYAQRSQSMASDIAQLLVDLGYRFTILQTGKMCDTSHDLLEIVGMYQVDLLCTVAHKEK